VTGIAVPLLKYGTADMEETIEFPMCNCYSSRGGLTISVFDGALQGHLATGYISQVETENTTTDWYNASLDQDNYTKTVGKPFVSFPNLPEPSEKYPSSPTNDKISIVYVMLNARARVAPCCYYQGNPWQYTAKHFRAIDLAVAQHKVKSGKEIGETNTFGDTPTPMSNKVGISDQVEYEYIDSDYHGGDDGYFKDILLGRNFDPSLPDVGNNSRVIYALSNLVTGDLIRDLRTEDKDECNDLPDGAWHFDDDYMFSPKNCGHPQCEVKYRWGHLCNGGGAFDLAEGKACPYYENPILGDKDSDKHCKLQKMYPGDSVTAAALLELMWATKGGIPWTKEEWEDTWQVPYVWATVPFSPIAVQSDIIEDEAGNKIQGYQHTEYRLYSQRTSINLVNGEIEVKPPRLLPGGTVSMRERREDETLDDGEKIPDFPTIIKNIQLNPMGSVRIVWPIPEISKAMDVDVSDSDAYLEKLKEIKGAVYNKLVWSKDGLKTEVVVQASVYEFDYGIYCINTAFLQGGDWVEKRELLEKKLEGVDIFSSETQKLLKDLWHDLINSKLAGNESVLKQMGTLKQPVTANGTVVFPEVPLSCLEDENHIIVFGFSNSGMISASKVKVRPIFAHGYAYQAETELMTTWKAVWNGRPSLFYNYRNLLSINESEADGRKIEKGKELHISRDGMTYNPYTGSPISLSSLDRIIAEQQAKLDTLIYQATLISNKDEKLVVNKEITNTQAYLSSLIGQREKEVSTSAEIRASLYSDTKSTEAIREEMTARIRDLNTIITEYKNKLASDKVVDPVRSVYVSVRDSYKEERDALQKTLDNLQPTEEEEEDPDTDNDYEAVEYNYKSTEIDADGGDPDTDEGGDIGIKQQDDGTDDPETIPTRCYVPYLNSDVGKHKDLSAYKVLSKSNSNEDINLVIPKESGVTTWKNMEVSQEDGSVLVAKQSFPAKAARKVIVYSTRESDNPDSTVGDDQPKGVKLTEDLGKWYKTSSCNGMVVFVMNPEIFNRHNERMIFSITGKMTTEARGPDNSVIETDKLIKFAPMNYTQVYRPFPGWTQNKSAVNIGQETVDDITYSKVQVAEDVEILELDESTRHPWVFLATPVTEDTNVLEWRFYNGDWFPDIPGMQRTIIPDKAELELYIEFAYIAEIYDQHGSDQYEWDEDAGECQTSVLFNHPKAGIIRTVFNYEGDNEVDEFTSVPMGSSAMATLWPYARQACRDFEITYVWRDMYKGKELTVQNMNGTWNLSRQGQHNVTHSAPRSFTYYTQGDHDLGTEYQPRISYKDTSVREENMNVGIYNVARSAMNDTFETRTNDAIGKHPTNSFPTGERVISAPRRDAQGATYYPYTRTEEYSLYMPRHKTYIWDFIDKWRNKPVERQDLGALRMRASDWCIRGTDEGVQRKRKWNRYWYYDPKKETEFLGRSKTRGPVFPLEYREYFELPTKTVFLKPYSARTGNKDWYCPECNRYFTFEAVPLSCPYCGSTSIEHVSGWDAHWMTLLDRVETEETTYTPPSTLVPGTEASEADHRDPAGPTDYEKWKAMLTQLFNSWVGASGDTKTKIYADFEREQARGRQSGWYANIIGGKLEFVNDITEEQESAAHQAAEAASRDMLTGCEEVDQGKREDTGSFQVVDDYVPGSPDPSATINDAAVERLEQEVQVAEQKYAKAVEDRKRFESWHDIMKESPNTIYTEGGINYSVRSEDPRYAPSENSITDKIENLKGIESEAENDLDKKQDALDKAYGNSAAGFYRKSILEKAAAARAKIEETCNRYYEYTQKSFGYNNPWSPYDSPPLFGNMGREMWAMELCTIGSMISWLPRTKDKIITTNTWSANETPDVPSWWTARNPEGEPREMVTLLAPPIECTRAIDILSSEAQNPYYHYLFNDIPFLEEGPEIEADSEFIFADRYFVKHLRIVTKYDTDHQGEYGYRSDVGRFTLTVKSEDDTDKDYTKDFKVHGDSPSMYDSYDNVFDPVTSFAESQTPEEDNSVRPNYYIEGAEVKGFAVGHNNTMSVGDRYPGFNSPYDHGKFFVGYQSLGYKYIHWAWPVSNRDILYREKKLIRWYPDLPPENPKDERKFESDAKEDAGLYAISTLECAPYFRKRALEDLDDGREISGGPKLEENKESRETGDLEPKYKNTYFGIVVESERADKNGRLRPPLIWVEQLKNKDFTDIGNFKVPSSDSMPHRITELGALQPVKLAEGDENEKDDKGNPAYETAFSTGSITDLTSDNYKNPDGGANLFTSKGINESGYFPGFIAGAIDYNCVAKVFQEKELIDRKVNADDTWGDVRLQKKVPAKGQGIHTVTGEFKINSLEANASYLKINLDPWFEEGNIKDFLSAYSDSIALQVSVYGDPLPGANTEMSHYKAIFMTELPVDPDVTTSDLEIMYDLDFGLTRNLTIKLVWVVKTDIATFYEGPWRGRETKTEQVWVDDSPYDETPGQWVTKTIPNEDNYCYLNYLVSSLKLGVLLPGKCAEVVEVEERGFVVSVGLESSRAGYKYNLFEDANSEDYKPNWEKSYNKTDPKEGWWKDSGRVEDTWLQYNYNHMVSRLQDSDDTIGKVQKAQVFPKACVEIPELCLSSLKIDAWDKDVPKVGGKDWTYGGVWTTRMAGPEWVTNDQYPTRDKIWWPAFPNKEGTIVLKGRYFSFGHQYKDEAKVISFKRRREIEVEDKYNENAYKYEINGFDALLQNIQELEQLPAETRRSAAYSRTYGVDPSTGKDSRFKAQETSPGQPYYNLIEKDISGEDGNLSNRWLGGIGEKGRFTPSSYGEAQTNDILSSKNWANAMANSAIDGILHSLQKGRNWMVSDRRKWLLLEDSMMDVDKISWVTLRKRENLQMDLFNESSAKNVTGDSSISVLSIIPYYDWLEMFEITGGLLKGRHGFEARGGREPLDMERDIQNIKYTSVFTWKNWQWYEVDSFSFRGEGTDKYPLKKKVDTKRWSTLLIRKCGERYVHNKAGQVSTDTCEDNDGSKYWGALGGEDNKPDCKAIEQKWNPPSNYDVLGGATWPNAWQPHITQGDELKRPDPWWRF
jgi:hypothetical protein